MHAIAELLLDGGHRPRRVIETQPAIGLRARHGKQQRVPHACIEIARDRIECRGLAEPRVVVAESCNRLRSGRALDDEVRLDELRSGERRLRRQIAQVR
jgi:hypothetical protein